MESKLSLKKILGYLLIGVTAVQCVFALIWIGANITVIPNDTVNTLYNEASKTFTADDWQSLYYVFFLFFVRLAAFRNETAFAVLTYVIQFVVFAFACQTLSKKYFESKVCRRCFALFVLTNPLVLQVIFSLTPYSFRAAGVLFLTAGLITIKERRKKAVLIGFTLLSIIMLLVSNKNICEAGTYGRTERSLSFLCCYHTLWPHLSEAGYYLGDDFVEAHGGEFKDIDSDSEKMIFEFGNYISEEYTDAESRDYRFMYLAENALKTWPREIVTSNAKTVLEYTFTPYAGLFINIFKIKGTNEAAVEALFTHGIKGLFELYLKFSGISFLIISLMTLFLKAPKLKKAISTVIVSGLIAMVVNYMVIRGFDYREGLLITIFYMTFMFRIMSMAGVEK